MITGGQITARALHKHGVDTVFCVPGESYLPVLDALLDFPDIKVITCRHESGATFMAEAYANLTGKVGVAMVTRGPGACNASIGIHNARQSSAPVILLAGLISTQDSGKEAFQEFDLPQMFGTHTKWSWHIARADYIARTMTKAFHIAREGRPGPVVLGLPEDILSAPVADAPIRPRPVTPLHPQDRSVRALARILSQAQRPVVIVGGSGWSDESCAALRGFCEKHRLPVAASFRRQDIFDHASVCYIGELGFGPNPALVERVKKADVVLVLGARISDVLTQGYTLFQRNQTLVHVYPSAKVFGKAYKPDLKITAQPWNLVAALEKVLPEGAPWDGWCRAGREAYEQWTAIDAQAGPWWNGADMTKIFGRLRDLLPRDAVVTTDAGNFSGWCNRYLRYGRPGRQLGPLSGAMGYAVPAAVAAAITQPKKLVLGVCGDGGFLMTGHELATAVHHGAAPIIMVCNNNMYGTIRMHQEREFPGRVSATALTNPDFLKLGESYGAFTARMRDAADFESAWKAAVAARRPALIEIAMDPRQISTTSKV